MTGATAVDAEKVWLREQVARAKLAMERVWDEGFDAGRNHETDAYWGGELHDPVNPYAPTATDKPTP